MNSETQKIVDNLDWLRAAICHHAGYETQDLLYYLAVAADLIEELAGVKEQLAGMEITLTVAQSAAERWERKCKEALSNLETTTRERDAAVEDLSNSADACVFCKKINAACRAFEPCGECEFEWRGVPQEGEA